MRTFVACTTLFAVHLVFIRHSPVTALYVDTASVHWIPNPIFVTSDTLSVDFVMDSVHLPSIATPSQQPLPTPSSSHNMLEAPTVKEVSFIMPQRVSAVSPAAATPSFPPPPPQQPPATVLPAPTTARPPAVLPAPTVAGPPVPSAQPSPSPLSAPSSSPPPPPPPPPPATRRPVAAKPSATPTPLLKSESLAASATPAPTGFASLSPVTKALLIGVPILLMLFLALLTWACLRRLKYKKQARVKALYDPEASSGPEKRGVALFDLFGGMIGLSVAATGTSKDPVADWVKQQQKKTVTPSTPITDSSLPAQQQQMRQAPAQTKPVVPTLKIEVPGKADDDAGAETASSRARARKAPLPSPTNTHSSSASSSSGSSGSRARKLRSAKSAPNLFAAPDDLPLVNFVPNYNISQTNVNSNVGARAPGIRQANPNLLRPNHTHSPSASSSSGSSSTGYPSTASSRSQHSAASSGSETLAAKKTLFEESLFTPGSMLSTAPPPVPEINIRQPPAAPTATFLLPPISAMGGLLSLQQQQQQHQQHQPPSPSAYSGPPYGGGMFSPGATSPHHGFMHIHQPPPPSSASSYSTSSSASGGGGGYYPQYYHQPYGPMQYMGPMPYMPYPEYGRHAMPPPPSGLYSDAAAAAAMPVSAAARGRSRSRGRSSASSTSTGSGGGTTDQKPARGRSRKRSRSSKPKTGKKGARSRSRAAADVAAQEDKDVLDSEYEKLVVVQ
ncbi:hypothetical protein HDU88_005910 [Geranomyces variabilis]|nr:hypothetical protein HDU88_005910 [Geranomyces variabilis]